MRDFTIVIYNILLSELRLNNYTFQTVHESFVCPNTRSIILRHDVDDRKENSLQFARIQYELGIVGTYYFRIIPQSFEPKVVQQIASLGHEIGYHYEDMDFAKGDPHKAIELFDKHLKQLREVADVKTICMHGSPLSKYDNRDLWNHYDYRDFGIIAEPYFDLDFSTILYLTDTGRRWNGDNVSIRDRSASDRINPYMEGKRPLSDNYKFRSTFDIIQACGKGDLPDKIMFNFHPQRWTDNNMLWTSELISQNVKNTVKWAINKYR